MLLLISTTERGLSFFYIYSRWQSASRVRRRNSPNRNSANGIFASTASHRASASASASAVRCRRTKLRPHWRRKRSTPSEIRPTSTCTSTSTSTRTTVQYVYTVFRSCVLDRAAEREVKKRTPNDDDGRWTRKRYCRTDAAAMMENESRRWDVRWRGVRLRVFEYRVNKTRIGREKIGYDRLRRIPL